MNPLARTSLRFRLMLLVIVAILPVASLHVYNILQERDNKLANLDEDVVRMAEFTANTFGELVTATRQTLVGLSNSGLSTQTPSRTGSVLAEILGHQPTASNFGLVQPDGLVSASAVPCGRNTYCNNLSWFRRIQQTRSFCVGDYEVDKVTLETGISFACPLLNQPANKPVASLYVTLTPEALQKIIRKTRLPQNAVINLVDRNGIEIARNPEIQGFRGRKSRAWHGIKPSEIPQKKPFEIIGLDNVRRAYYFTPVKESGDALWVGVGFSSASVLAQARQQLIWEVTGMVFIALFAIALAWYGSEIWVLRPVHALTQVSRRLAQGDLKARTNATDSPRELRLLAQTFDDMAASLQKSQDELRLTQFAVDHAPEAILWTTPEGRLIYANEAAVGALSYPLTSLLKMQKHEIDVGMTAESWPDYWENLVKFRTLAFESRYRTCSGREVPVEIRSNYLKFGTREYNCCFVHDITERKQAEEDLRTLNAELELRVQNRTAALEKMNASLTAEIAMRQKVEKSLSQSEQTLSTLMSNLPGMVYRCLNDQRWTMRLASEGALALTGYSPTDLIDNKSISYSELVHPDDKERIWNEIQMSLKKREPFRVLYRIRCANGREKWVSERGRGIFAENDSLVALEGFISDTTKRKQAEEEVFNAHAMLELILDNIPQRVFWKDLESNYLGCNQPFATDGGLSSPQEITGKTDHQLFTAEAAEKFRSDDQWVMKNNTAKLNFEEAQGQLDGLQRWVRTNKIPLHNRDGAVIGVLGTYEDITEHRQMEQKLKESMEDLERSNHELEQFAYVASHDLQEPLRLVSSYTQLLSHRYKGKLDATADEFIGFAVDGAMRMQRLIQDLLAYSRVTSKETPTEPTDCNACLRQALANLSVSIEESKSQITTDPLPTVLAAENHMVQLFQNLLGNAIKFRSQEAPRIHIGAVASEDQSTWTFSISDNGIGIAPEFFERIFAIFQRLHTRRKYAGTGIGLAVCKRIVERHGGRIWVESEPGKGSIFYFTLSAGK